MNPLTIFIESETRRHSHLLLLPFFTVLLLGCEDHLTCFFWKLLCSVWALKYCYWNLYAITLRFFVICIVQLRIKFGVNLHLLTSHIGSTPLWWSAVIFYGKVAIYLIGAGWKLWWHWGTQPTSLTMFVAQIWIIKQTFE